ncbi:fatty aldehyde dehydrogenase [Planoprotostelium fungivorum]|uniref:Aldehyde dehydrogenase n=1 Tax=Planoprotostelium fungivorum TaxID=1890364 RepID=A0A2P6NZK8_9EUKA|nr:fatty aldehyde dehydrogenase [Planoprotostelium fungivorum]
MSTLAYTPVSDIKDVVNQVRQGFNTRASLPLEYRKKQLQAIKRCLLDNAEQWKSGLQQDLGMDLLLQTTEVEFVVNEINFLLDNLSTWAAPEVRSVPLYTQPASGYIIKEPLGVVLVMGAWNYPISLVIKPLLGAIAAGNAAIIKPSEISVNTARNFATLLPKYLDPALFAVVTGAVDQATELLKHKFDHIVYTGNGKVAKIVATAAAQHLTPTTLELGGKSPVIVDDTISLSTAASRIVWGKYANAGQTCVAPDYVFVKREVLPEFLHQLSQHIRKYYGEDPKVSPDYSRIVNLNHVNRILDLLEGQNIYHGGNYNQADRYISPTIIIEPEENSKILTEEIFGPLLPVLPYDHLDDVIRYVSNRPKPLALYIFSNSKSNQKKIIEGTSSGGVSINEVVSHVSCSNLPFGGVGDSGMGSYNGKASFDTFSHHRSVLKRSWLPDPAIRFPPFSQGKVSTVKALASLRIPKMKTLAIPVLIGILLTYRKPITRILGF